MRSMEVRFDKDWKTSSDLYKATSILPFHFQPLTQKFYPHNNKMDKEVKLEEEIDPQPQFNEELENKLCLSEHKESDEVKQEQGSPFKRDHQGSSWLYNICLISKIPFRDCLGWSWDLLSFIKNHTPSRKQQIIRLSFKAFLPKEQYYCSIFPVDYSFAIIKVRDREGCPLFFKEIQLKQIMKEIHNFLKTMPTNSINIIFDQTASCKSLVQNISDVFSNVVYIHLLADQNSTANVKSNCIYKKINNFMVLSPKKLIKKIDSFENIIDLFIQGQNEDRNKMLTLFRPDILSCHDWTSFLLNIVYQIEESSGQVTYDLVLQRLERGIQFLTEMVSKYDFHKYRHYPSKIQEKVLCWKCNKKKSQVTCQACQTIFERDIRLCIGSCFSQHHLFLERMSRDIRGDICKNINFFDGKMGDIFKEMTEIALDKENVHLLKKYMGYLNQKVVKQFTTMMEKKIERNCEESQ